MASTQFSGRISSLTGGSVHVTRVVGVLLALLGSIIGWVIADPIGGANLSATGTGSDNSSKIGVGEVIGGFASWGVGSLIVVYLIDRFSSTPQKLWLIISVIALLISFIFVFTGADNTATTVTFCIMHLVSAAIIIPTFMGTLRERKA